MRMGHIDNRPDAADKGGVLAQFFDIARLGWRLARGMYFVKPLQNGFRHFLQGGVQSFAVAMAVGQIRRNGAETGIFDIVNHNRVTHSGFLFLMI
jgi:hypothetical protein